MSLIIESDMATIKDNCYECTFQFGGHCSVQPSVIDDALVPHEGKPGWCPLKELGATLLIKESFAWLEKEAPVWCEWPSGELHSDIFCGANEVYVCFSHHYENGARSCRLDEYNKTWRAWYGKPTDEQRKKAKWFDKKCPYYHGVCGIDEQYICFAASDEKCKIRIEHEKGSGNE